MGHPIYKEVSEITVPGRGKEFVTVGRRQKDINFPRPRGDHVFSVDNINVTSLDSLLDRDSKYGACVYSKAIPLIMFNIFNVN
jgi:hypothetical protein